MLILYYKNEVGWGEVDTKEIRKWSSVNQATADTFKLLKQIEWCNENSTDWWCIRNSMFYFKNKHDSVLFKLVWV